MKKRAELIQEIKAQRKTVMDLLTNGNVDEAKKANDKLTEMETELDKLPVQAERKVEMNEKEKMQQLKKAVNSFVRHGFAGMSDEEKRIVKPANATDSPGQVESTTVGTKGAALVPVSTADFVMTMDAGVYRLRDKCFNYFANTKSGKIPIVGNPTDTLTEFDELPAGGLSKSDITINSVNFDCRNIGTIVPVSNQLLADELASVYDVIMDNFAKKARNKENAMILAAIDGNGAGVAVHTWQEIADAVNATDPVDSNSKIIITNTDGGSFLADQVDNDHYVLIQPNAMSPKKYFRGYEVIQLPLSILPNTTDSEVPFYVGSLYDAICFVERQGLLISMNPYGAGFEQDATEVKVTARYDCKTKFAGAMKKLLYTAPEE